MDFSWLIPVISALLPVIVIIIIIFVIVGKVRRATKEYLNMTPSETLDMIGKGLKEETTTPKGITALSEMYGPAITRDFPEIGYKGMEIKAENAIVAILNAITDKNTALLGADEFSQDLIKKVNNRIVSLNARGEKEIYNSVKVHRCGLASY